MAERNNVLEGSINKSILFLSVPIMFAMFLQIVYSLVDTFWVGRLGAGAVAAVSISFPVIFLIVSLGGGLTMAGTVLVSQYFGRKNMERVNFSAGQVLSFVFFISIILSVLGYFFSGNLASLIGAEQTIFEDAVGYLRISFLGIFFMFGYIAFQSLIRGVGEVKFPLYIVLGTVVLNFFLDPLFIIGYLGFPSLGVKGAALATIITQGLSAIVGIPLLFTGKFGIKIQRKNLKPKFSFWKRIFSLGLPSSFERSFTAIGIFLMTLLVVRFGTEGVASFGLGTRILSFIIISAVSLSIAMSTIIGQHIGARKLERAGTISNRGMWIGFIVPTILGILLFIFVKPIVSIFIPGETNVIEMASFFIKLMALTFGFLGLQMVIAGIFRGAGRTGIAMLISFSSTFVMFFSALILSNRIGIDGIWYSYPLSNVVSGAIAFILIFKLDWKHRKTIED